MAEDGIVGEYNGSQARDILITLEQWAEMQGEKPEAEPPPLKPKKNRILPARDEHLEDDEEEDDDHEDDDDPDDDAPFDDDPDDVLDEDEEEEDEGPPIRGPHRTPFSNPRSTTSASLMVEPEDDEAADECDEDGCVIAETGTEDSDDEAADSGDGDTASNEDAADDERYAHINPALLARLRAKRLYEQQQRLRRSA
jgi:hypothetical protein